MHPSLRAKVILLAQAERLIPSPYPYDRVDEKLTDTDAKEVERIVRSELKDKETEERIVKIIRNVLVQFTKTLYNQRGFWVNTLNSQPN